MAITATDLEIRWIRQADAASVAALIRLAFATLPDPADPPPSALHVAAADLRAHLAAGGGGAVAPAMRACLLWVQHGDALHLSRLAVDPRHRKLGLATALLTAAETHASRLGLHRLSLSTRLSFTANRRLFRHYGFTEGALHSHAGYAEPTFVDMHKRLGEPAGALRVITGGQ